MSSNSQQTRMTIRVDEQQLVNIDKLVENEIYNNRSHYIRTLIDTDLKNRDESDLKPSNLKYVLIDEMQEKTRKYIEAIYNLEYAERLKIFERGEQLVDFEKQWAEIDTKNKRAELASFLIEPSWRSILRKITFFSFNSVIIKRIYTVNTTFFIRIFIVSRILRQLKTEKSFRKKTGFVGYRGFDINNDWKAFDLINGKIRSEFMFEKDFSISFEDLKSVQENILELDIFEKSEVSETFTKDGKKIQKTNTYIKSIDEDLEWLQYFPLITNQSITKLVYDFDEPFLFEPIDNQSFNEKSKLDVLIEKLWPEASEEEIVYFFTIRYFWWIDSHNLHGFLPALGNFTEMCRALFPKIGKLKVEEIIKNINGLTIHKNGSLTWNDYQEYSKFARDLSFFPIHES